MCMENTFNQQNNDNYLKLIESSPAVLGIFNFHTLDYDFVSNNIKDLFGYTSEEFIEGGVDFNYSIIDNVHANIISGKIYPVFLEHCIKYSDMNKLMDLQFSYEYRVNCKSGKAIWCLRQSRIAELDDFKHPFKETFSIVSIDEYKKDESVKFVISLKNDEGYETIYFEKINQHEFSILSEREVQILKLLSEGNSTPEIAEILCLSEHTIKSHRKNIMQKLDVKNSLDSIKKALEKGIL